MANNDDIGKYARHPRRTAGSAFLIGTALGASVMAVKKSHEKNALQKLIDQISR